MSQLSSALLHANHTLSAIDHLVRGQAAARPQTHTQTGSPHWEMGPLPEKRNPNSQSRPQDSESQTQTCRPQNVQQTPHTDCKSGPSNLNPDLGLRLKPRCKRTTSPSPDLQLIAQSPVTLASALRSDPDLIRGPNASLGASVLRPRLQIRGLTPFPSSRMRPSLTSNLRSHIRADPGLWNPDRTPDSEGICQHQT